MRPLVTFGVGLAFFFSGKDGSSGESEALRFFKPLQKKF